MGITGGIYAAGLAGSTQGAETCRACDSLEVESQPILVDFLLIEAAPLEAAGIEPVVNEKPNRLMACGLRS